MNRARHTAEMLETERLIVDAEEAGLCTCGVYGDERPLWADDCPQHEDAGEDCAWWRDENDEDDEDDEDDDSIGGAE